MDPPRFDLLTNSCLVNAVMNAAMGGVLGFAAGLVMGSFEAMTPSYSPGVLAQQLPLKQELIRSYRRIWLKMRSWAKNFAVLTGI